MSEQLERAVAALHDATRRGILLRFYEDPRPRTVDEVAAAAGVHRTVAFSHLERLRALGYLATGSRRGLRGKPARLYRLGSEPLELSHPARRYRLLATLFGQVVAGVGRPGREAARQAGRDFGRQAAEAAGTDAPREPRHALESLDGLGAAYDVCGERIVAHNCVFQEACAGGVACELQAGILEGALAGAGIAADVQPDGREGSGCAYHMHMREGETETWIQ